MRIAEDGWQSPIAKFCPSEQKDIKKNRRRRAGDVLFSADSFKIVNDALGALPASG
jgi:hypothetical protein